MAFAEAFVGIKVGIGVVVGVGVVEVVVGGGVVDDVVVAAGVVVGRAHGSSNCSGAPQHSTMPEQQ